ncbi:MAG: nitronate monooxygenase, partial [Bacteroidales bacterium]|nr:nitronate monooxygenase [Bacteroidales bacterium]
NTQKPKLSTITGGLSGPAIKPVALRMVWQVSKAVKIPICGLGGIMNAGDAIEFMLAGASCVQIGTANFINPSVTTEIINGIYEYCSSKGISDINDIIGKI